MDNKKGKSGQFVCYDVLKSEPIHKVYENNGKENHVTYTALRFYFHSWYKKLSNKAFIIASQYLPFKNYGVQTHPREDLRNFLACWSDDDTLTEDAVYALSYQDIKESCVSVNADIDYEIENGVTIIKTISPVTSDKCITINSRLKTPLYLLPGYEKTAPVTKLNLMAKVDKQVQDEIEELTSVESPVDNLLNEDE